MSRRTSEFDLLKILADHEASIERLHRLLGRVNAASGTSLAGLSDTTITAPGDGEVLQYSSGSWINQTLAEAGISADTHDHDGDYVNVTGDTMTGDLVIGNGADLRVSGASNNWDAYGSTTDYYFEPQTADGSIVWRNFANADILTVVTSTKAWTLYGDLTVSGADVSATTFTEGGTTLSAKYLGISAQAADSALLGGKTEATLDVDSATRWATGRTITLTGDVTGTSAAWDGTGNLSFVTTVANDSHTHGPGTWSGNASDLDDVTITSIAAGEILKWSGSAWVNNTLAEAGIAASGHNHDSDYIELTDTFGGDVSGTYNAIVVANDSHTHDTRYYTESEADAAFAAIGHSHAEEYDLEDLGDVTITGPLTTGDVIRWNGSAWVDIPQTSLTNVASAAKWTTGRTITLTGDVTGTSAAWDGSGNISFATTLQAPVSLQRIHLKKTAAGESVAQSATVNVGWDNSFYKDAAAYTHSTSTNNHQITVAATGVYQIVGNIMIEIATASARSTHMVRVAVNGAEIDSTATVGYTRGTSYGTYASGSINTVLSLTANDIVSIEVYGENIDGTTTISEEFSELIIYRLGIEAVTNTDTQLTAAEIRTLGFFDTSNDGAGSGLDADLLDGQHGSYYLNTSTSFGGDVSGTYGAIVVANDSHTHNSHTLAGDVTGTLGATVVGNDSHTHGPGTWSGDVSDLDDVTITAAGAGDVLRYSGSAWVDVAETTLSVAEAAAWTTGRTITLTGDVTGTSAAWDGSGNISFATVVGNDSHTHDTRYYTESEIDTTLAGYSTTGHTHSYLPLSGGTLTGTLTSRQITVANTYDILAATEGGSDIGSASNAFGGFYGQTLYDEDGTLRWDLKGGAAGSQTIDATTVGPYWASGLVYTDGGSYRFEGNYTSTAARTVGTDWAPIMNVAGNYSLGHDHSAVHFATLGVSADVTGDQNVARWVGLLMDHDLAVGAATNLTGIQNVINSEGTSGATQTTVRAQYNQASVYGANTVTSLYVTDSYLQMGSSASTGLIASTDAAVLRATGGVSSGAAQSTTVTNLYGLWVDISGGIENGTSTVTNYYGVKLDDPIYPGTTTTAYGLYIENITAGATNRSLYVAGGESHLLGQVTTHAIVPDSDNARDLGNATTSWRRLYAFELWDETGALRLDLNSPQAYGSWKFSADSHVFGATTAKAATLTVSGPDQPNYPTLGTWSGAFGITNSDPNYGLDVGVTNGGTVWLQAHRNNAVGTAYTLALNPSGGPVTVGGNTVLTTASSFAGDVTGTSGAMVVGDDSHTHGAGTVSGFLPLSGGTMTGAINAGGYDLTNVDLFGRHLSNNLEASDANNLDSTGWNAKFLTSAAANSPTGTDHAVMTMAYSSAWAVQLAGDWRTNKWYVRTEENTVWKSWAEIVTDQFALAGDVTGTPGATVVGNDSHTHNSHTLAGDVTGTLSATVVGNDSHTHDTRYYTESEIDARTIDDLHSAMTFDSNGLKITGVDPYTTQRAWLTLDSPGSGGSYDDQVAGISVGESGFKGSAAMHFVYSGDGYGHIGMGTVTDGVDPPMAHRVLRMQYTGGTVQAYQVWNFTEAVDFDVAPTTGGNTIITDGTAFAGDVTGTVGATVVANDSHTHNSHTLAGDVTGTLSATVVGNDSHTHTEAFITDLGSYMPISGGTFTGTITTGGTGITFAGSDYLNHNATASRDKIRVWNSSSYTIGMDNGFNAGHLGSDTIGSGTTEYAMTFQMNNSDIRGFWWGDASHTDSQAAMTLTTNGKLWVYNDIYVGEGSYTTARRVLHEEDTFGGDVSGTYDAIVVANDSHTHNSHTLAGDVTGTLSATVVGNDSHTHNSHTLAGDVTGTLSATVVGNDSHDHFNWRALDDRDIKPNVADTPGNYTVKAYFTSLEGLTGASGTDYQDFIVFDTYADGTGGDMNALAFDKSEMLIRYYQADQADTTWGDPHIILTDNYSNTYFDDSTTTDYRVRWTFTETSGAANASTWVTHGAQIIDINYTIDHDRNRDTMYGFYVDTDIDSNTTDNTARLGGVYGLNNWTTVLSNVRTTWSNTGDHHYTHKGYQANSVVGFRSNIYAWGEVNVSSGHHGVEVVVQAGSTSANQTGTVTTADTSGAKFTVSSHSETSRTTTMTDKFGVWLVRNGTQQGTTTLTNTYGVYVGGDTTAGTVTNAYGVYIEGETVGGTTNKSIYVAAGESYFGGKVEVDYGTGSSGLWIGQDLQDVGNVQQLYATRSAGGAGTTEVGYYSSRRSNKTDIEALADRPDLWDPYDIDDILPVTYIRKSTEQREFGFIIHGGDEPDQPSDLGVVNPYLTSDGDQVGDSPDPMALLAIAIGEIQSLRARVAELEGGAQPRPPKPTEHDALAAVRAGGSKEARDAKKAAVAEAAEARMAEKLAEVPNRRKAKADKEKNDLVNYLIDEYAEGDEIDLAAVNWERDVEVNFYNFDFEEMFPEAERGVVPISEIEALRP